MARKREPVKPVESQSDSGEEEDVDGTSEEADSQESDSESEQTQTATQKKSQPQMPAKPLQSPPQPPQSQKPHSSSEEEESGSESESESDGPALIVRPLASKPIETKSSNEAKKVRSKPNEPVTPTKSTAAKRSAEDTTMDTKDSKKKKTAEPETSEKKSNLFQRLWTEDDEIAILEGMIDYKAKKKLDPILDLHAFHDFIKKNLHIDFSKTQLQDKIRRLRKKYENNKSKVKVGKERTFSKPHEQKAYDLSKTIWGNGTGKEKVGEKVVGSPKANGSVLRKTASKKVNSSQNEDEDEVKDVKNGMVVSGEKGEKLPVKKLNSNSSGTSLEERMLIAGRGLDGEQEWEELRVQELHLYLKQLEVKVAQTKLVLDMMKAGDH